MSNTLLIVIVRVQCAVVEGRVRSRSSAACLPPRFQRGQAVTEYVLLLLGVAALALGVATWAARTGKIGELLDRVFDAISAQVS